MQNILKIQKNVKEDIVSQQEENLTTFLTIYSRTKQGG